LHPTIVQLERAAGFERGDTPEMKLRKIEQLLAPTSSPVAGLPLVAELLHIPAGDLYPPSQLNPNRKKEETFELLLHQLVVLAQSRPVFLVHKTSIGSTQAHRSSSIAWSIGWQACQYCC
jgi:hypothetical protein